MKILRIAWWKRPYRGGGLIEYVEDIIEEMLKRGHQEIYFFPGSYNLKLKPYIKEYKRNGVKCYELVNSPNIAPKKIGNPLSECQQEKIESLFEEVILKEMPDIVHIHEFEGLTAGIIDVIKKYDIPLVFSIHNYWTLCPQVELFDYVTNQICNDYEDGKRCVRCEIYSSYKTTELTKWIRRAENFKKYSFIYNFMKVVHRMAGNIFKNFRTHSNREAVNSEKQAEMYVKRRECFIEKLNMKVDKILAISNIAKEIYIRYGINEAKIEVVYRGLKKLDSIKPKPLRKNNIFPVVFGFIGGCAIHKGIDLLIYAFSKLDQKKVKLVIYGGKNQKYINKIKNQQLNIDFRGIYNIENIDKVLEEIDVGVVPSIWYETFGLVGTEFLQARIPIIVSDTCGVAETIKNGKTGFIFNSNDVNSLFEKMELFVMNPEIIKKFEKNIKRSKTIEEHGTEIEKIYENLIKR
jgi:glycosyltransferase involved in cell wall biosynthesis